MATNKLQWKRIAKGDKLPCQSFLRKKDGEILKLSTGAGVTVGQDAYYLSVNDVIEEIKNYPIEESEDERIRKEIISMSDTLGRKDWIAWLEEQGEHANFRNKIQIGDKVTRNEDGVLVNLSQLNRVAKKDEKQGKQKHQYISRPRYIGEEELLGTNKQGKCHFSKQELIDMGFAFTQDGDLAYPIHKIEKKEFAAWSEEDEKVLDNILYILNQLKDTTPHKEDETAKECIDKLKSLKDRFTWKPSDEQIKAVKLARSFVVDDFDEHPALSEILIELEEQLKKLREE